MSDSAYIPTAERSTDTKLLLNQADTKAARLPVLSGNAQNTDAVPNNHQVPPEHRDPASTCSNAAGTEGTETAATDATTRTDPDPVTQKPRSRIVILAGAAAALLLTLGLCVWQHFSSYENAASLARDGLPGKAQEVLFLPQMTSVHDPDFLTYLEGRILLNEMDYASARTLLEPLAHNGYLDTESLMTEINYYQGSLALAQGNFPLAIDYLEEPARADYLDSWMLYCNAKLDYCKNLIGNISNIDDVQLALAYLADVVGEGFMPALYAQESIQGTVYTYALDLYAYGWLSEAAPYFQSLNNYAQASEYLVLCNTCSNTTTVEQLWALRDFANANEILLTQFYLCEFLVGTWSTASGVYYYNMEAMSGDSEYAYYCTYNLPWQYSGDFVIESGIYKVYHNGGSAALNEFMISIVSWDKIAVYCYKDGSTYTLYRQ